MTRVPGQARRLAPVALRWTGSQGMASQLDEPVAMRGLWAAAEKADHMPPGVALRTEF